jgi:hypothetical protein
MEIYGSESAFPTILIIKTIFHKVPGVSIWIKKEIESDFISI